MRWLIAAPCAAPRFEGPQLVAAARRRFDEAALFDSDASRDPTLELPTVARRYRPDVLLVVAPEREDPTTLGLVRDAGARVAVWLGRLSERAPPHLAGRRRWIARASDVVAATGPEVLADLEEAGVRGAIQLAGGFDRETLGDGDPARAAAGEVVAVRAADDPLRIANGDASSHVVGYGDRDAFPGVRFGGPIEVGRFASVVAGRRYLAGGRLAVGPPGVFDDAAAARACGASVIEVGYLQSISSARSPDETPVSFEERLRVLADAVSAVT